MKTQSDSDARETILKAVQTAHAKAGLHAMLSAVAANLQKREVRKSGGASSRFRPAMQQLIQSLADAQRKGLTKLPGVALKIPKRGDHQLTTEWIKVCHAMGPQQLTKGIGLPPESDNARNDNNRDDDDGAELAHSNIDDERQRAGVRQRSTSYDDDGAAPHASSVRAVSALMTQDDGEPGDPTVKAIKAALRRPVALRPGSLRGDSDSRDRSPPAYRRSDPYTRR